ncbi:MAG: CTP synthase [bacterium]|nr:CTP synthase [bacterium]
MSKSKYIFVSGGVISGLGKGITTATTALLLKLYGFKVSVMKADMYLNLDAGTMNPLEHGEIFVTVDGAETDQDLGHYERFLGQDMNKENYFTMGQAYKNVLNKERSLAYGGKCVEGNIHIPEEIIQRIQEVQRKNKAEITVIEVGGTVGEYQNILFFEAIRRFKQKNPKNVALIHVVYLPVPSFLGEMKSKPAQASIYELYRLGLQPDFVICRSQQEIDHKRRHTIALNTGVKEENIIAAPDVDTIYRIPLLFENQGLAKKILKTLQLKPRKKTLNQWENFVAKIDKAKKEIKIAIVGKYFASGNFALEDSYVCVIEAIKHASWSLGIKPKIQWFDSERLENKKDAPRMEKELQTYQGIIVPQGWGSRGTEGKIKTIKLAREKKIPYLGLCFGMQMAVIEFARNVVGLKNANSTEVNQKTPYPIIHIMPEQEKYLNKRQYGGTIRLGQWPCKIRENTILSRAYGKETILERHRHRYEVNNDYRELLEKNGMIISGVSPDNQLVEAIELSQKHHPFFVGTQFHPEYQSRPLSPHPLFVAFIKAAAKTRL